MIYIYAIDRAFMWIVKMYRLTQLQRVNSYYFATSDDLTIIDGHG